MRRCCARSNCSGRALLLLFEKFSRPRQRSAFCRQTQIGPRESSPPKVGDRSPLQSLLATTGPVATLAQRSGKVEQRLSTESQDAIPVTLSVNGEKHDLRIDPRTTLLDCPREHLHLTGSKKGCDHGQCGACTVHINGRRVNSCLSFAAMHEGEEITTIEGIGPPENLDPMQSAFVACDAYQCGYCTSGQIDRK